MKKGTEKTQQPKVEQSKTPRLPKGFKNAPKVMLKQSGEKQVTSTNWMLDEAKSACKFCRQNDLRVVGGCPDIHAKEKIEYGRLIMSQIFKNCAGKTEAEFLAYVQNLDKQLIQRIIEVGGDPNEMVHDNSEPKK